MKRNNVRNVWKEGELQREKNGSNIRFHNTISSEERRRLIDLGILDVNGDFTKYQPNLTWTNDFIVRPYGW